MAKPSKLDSRLNLIIQRLKEGPATSQELRNLFTPPLSTSTLGDYIKYIETRRGLPVLHKSNRYELTLETNSANDFLGYRTCSKEVVEQWTILFLLSRRRNQSGTLDELYDAYSRLAEVSADVRKQYNLSSHINQTSFSKATFREYLLHLKDEGYIYVTKVQDSLPGSGRPKNLYTLSDSNPFPVFFDDNKLGAFLDNYHKSKSRLDTVQTEIYHRLINLYPPKTPEAPFNYEILGGRNKIPNTDTLNQLLALPFQEKCIRFIWVARNGNSCSAILRLGLIVFSVEKNSLYAIGKIHPNDTEGLSVFKAPYLNIRLDAVKEMIVTDDEPSLLPAFNSKEYQTLLNQMLSVSPEPPTDVVVRFAQKSHIEEKIHRLQAARDTTASLEAHTDYLEFIDTVRGEGDFAHLIRQYGPDAEIVKPASFREHLRRSSEKVLLAYEKEENTSNEQLS